MEAKVQGCRDFNPQSSTYDVRLRVRAASLEMGAQISTHNLPHVKWAKVKGKHTKLATRNLMTCECTQIVCNSCYGSTKESSKSFPQH
eukprot:6107249-Amphidinium_carterae.2